VNTLRYPAKALAGDYARAGIGVALTLTPSIGLGEWSVAHGFLLPLAVLFAGFGYKTWRRGRQSVTWDAIGVSLSGPGAARLDWNDLRSFKLAFFSTTRDRTGGWMQLKLSSDGARIDADSSGEGFADLVTAAFAEAERRSVSVDAASRENLKALGINATGIAR